MLPKTLLTTSIRDLRRRTWQLGLMVLGVAVGVSVVVGIDLANRAAMQGFTLSTQAVVGRATDQIRAGPSGVPSDLYRQIRVGLGVRESAPIVEGVGLAINSGDRPLRLLGVDPLAEAPFRGFLTEASYDEPGLAAFMSSPGSVLATAQLADSLGLMPGDVFDLSVNGTVHRLTLLGTLSGRPASGVGLPQDVLLTDVSTAQALLGMPNTLTRIDLIATQDQLAGIRSILPPGVSVEASSQQTSTAEQLASAFQLNLTALSLLALVVGMFLIYNTVMFSVVQRRTILATLRAIGVTNDQVFALVLFEAGLVGFLGTVLGIGLGWLMAQGAVRLETQTITDFYFVTTVRGAALSAPSVLKALGLGIGSSLAAAVGPAVEAAKIPPADALRPSTLESRVRRWIPWVSAAGLLLACLGAGVLVNVKTVLWANFAGMFLILFGVAMMVPAATLAMVWAADVFLARLLGSLGSLGARTVTKALSRTAIAIAALMVALSVTIGVGVMIQSFRSTVVNWLGLTLRADLYVSAPAPSGTRPSGNLPADLGPRLGSIPGVAQVQTFRAVTVQGRDGPVQLSVADAQSERQAGLYRFASGTASQVWTRVKGGAVIVSESYAYRHGIGASGGQVSLLTDHGWKTFAIAGVFYDYASDRGTVLMSSNVYHRDWNDPYVSSFALTLAPKANANQVADRVQEAITGTGLEVRSTGALRQDAMAVFDRTFAITAALRLLAIVVAFIGVLSSLLALQLERRQELATLEALGLTGRGVWELNSVETGLIGLTAGILSVPTGLMLAVVLIYVINLRSFGWTIQMTVNPWILLQAIMLGIVAALLAGVYPAYRMSRMQIVEALRRE